MNKVTDGRFRRTESTRQNILNVSRELILAGNLEPTARDIADTAGITTRTLFRHFPDMQALYRSLIEQAEGGAADVMNEPFAIDPHDSWRDCLSLVIDRRVRVYESILPLYVSTTWRRYQVSTSHKAGDHSGVNRRRRRLREVVPETIEPALFEALDATLSIEYWVSLRRDQGLSVKKAVETLRYAVTRLTQNG